MAQELTMEQLKGLISEAIKEEAKELNIGQAERKNGIVPQKTIEQENELAKKPLAERMKMFIKGAINKNDTVMKALGGGTGAEGGYLLPTDFRKQLIETLQLVGVMRPLVDVIPVGLRTGTVPTVGGKPKYAWDGENTSFTENDPNFGQLAYAVKRLDTYVPISQELIADTPIDVVGTLKKLFAEAYAYAEDEAMTVGDGTTIPVTGILNDTSITTADGNKAITYDMLVDAFYGLKAPYRKQAVFMTNSFGISVLRKLKDNYGRPLLLNPSTGGNPTIFGKPVIENPQFPIVEIDTNADSTPDTNTASLVIGAFKMAKYFDRGEFAVKATDVGGDAFVKNQILVKSWNRVDFKIAIGEAFVKIPNVY